MDRGSKILRAYTSSRRSLARGAVSGVSGTKTIRCWIVSAVEETSSGEHLTDRLFLSFWIYWSHWECFLPYKSKTSFYWIHTKPGQRPGFTGSDWTCRACFPFRCGQFLVCHMCIAAGFRRMKPAAFQPVSVGGGV